MNAWRKIQDGSKKNLIAVLTAVVLLANHYIGNPIPENVLLSLLGLACTWLVARGVADHGAGGTVRGSIRKGSQIHDMALKISDLLRAEQDIEITQNGREVTVLGTPKKSTPSKK